MIKELKGEYVGLVLWDESPKEFIHNALFDPASRVATDTHARRAVVKFDLKVREFVKPGKADPREGINLEKMTLISKMTGWEIILIETK
jgi:transcription antitermination factor NusA-like protein